jgi:hypothetical protein
VIWVEKCWFYAESYGNILKCIGICWNTLKCVDNGWLGQSVDSCWKILIYDEIHWHVEILIFLFVVTCYFVINKYMVISAIRFQRISHFKFVENVEINWSDIEIMLIFDETSGHYMLCASILTYFNVFNMFQYNFKWISTNFTQILTNLNELCRKSSTFRSMKLVETCWNMLKSI